MKEFFIIETEDGKSYLSLRGSERFINFIDDIFHASKFSSKEAAMSTCNMINSMYCRGLKLVIACYQINKKESISPKSSNYILYYHKGGR